MKFDDGSEIIVDNQYLYVSNHVTSTTRDKTPSDALKVEFKLGEGTKVDNTGGGAIEGNKDNPVSYSKYKVKPGTNLKDYKLPLINSSVIGSINLTPQKGYTEPVWKDKNNGENFIASANNNIFTATATKTYDVTLKGNNGKDDEKDKVTTKKNGETYTLPEGSTFTPPNENQEFSGWKVGDDTTLKKPGDKITVDGDKVVTAIWKPIELKVTFQTESGATGSMDPETVTKGSEFKIPEPKFTPDKNKEFAGWKIEGQEGIKNPNDKIENISGNLTLIATWKNIQVNVSYDANGGSGTMEGKKVDKGSDYTILPNSFKAPDDTQEFSHWEIDGKKVEANKAIKIDKDTVIKAIWKKIQVNVSYDANGGSGTMEGKKVDKGSDYTILPNSFKAPDDTQEFDTWEVNGKKVAAGTKIKVDKDTEIKALWKKTQVKVTYNANGGKGQMTEKDQDKGSEYVILENTFKSPDDTQEFKAWEVNGKEVAAGTKIKLDKDTEIKAIWKKIQVKVSYDANGGSGNMTGATKNKGSKYILLANTFKAPNENQEFKTWEVNGQELAPGSEITLEKDTVVKAVWKDIKVKEEVQVSFDGNGAKGNMPIQSLEKGKTYKLPENGFEVPEGKEFVGWKIGGEDKQAGDEITINENTTVVAQWKDKQVNPKPDESENPGKPGEGENPDKKPNPGKPGEGDNPDKKPDPGKPGDGENPDKKPDPGKPGEGENPDKKPDPDKPGEGENPDKKPDPSKPGEGDNPDKKPDPSKPGEDENPGNPGTKPGDGEEKPNPGKPDDGKEKPKPGEKDNTKKPGDDKITKKPKDNKENSLSNRKVQVTRTKDVKENVQTGVGSLGKIGGILSAAIAGLFASKKRKK